MEEKFKAELSTNHIESYRSWTNSKNTLSGMIVWKSFDYAFGFLTKNRDTVGVKIKNNLYIDWSWINMVCPNVEFFAAINNALNDDCILAVTKQLDLCHLIYFGTINLRFNNLIIKNQLREIFITPANVGLIDIMNLRYIMHLSKDSLAKLTISIDCFPTIFKIHSRDKKKAVLETIARHAGPKLKEVCLLKFNVDEDLNFCINMLIERGVSVEQKNVEIQPKCNASFRSI